MVNDDNSLFSGNLTTITNIVENLGVKSPNKNFLNLFFLSEQNPRGCGSLYYSRFTLREMKEIFISGDFKNLSEEYWKAKQKEDHNRCREIFNTACSFLPTSVPL